MIQGISIFTKILPKSSALSFSSLSNENLQLFLSDVSRLGNLFFGISTIKISYTFDGEETSSKAAFDLSISLSVKTLSFQPNTIDAIEKFIQNEYNLTRKWKTRHLHPNSDYSPSPESKKAYFDFLCRAIIATISFKSSEAIDLNEDSNLYQVDKVVTTSPLSQAYKLIENKLGPDGSLYVEKRLKMLQVRKNRIL